MTIPNLFAAGGAHIDRRGQIAGEYIPGASNPGIMREEVGGGVFNALRNAVRRGCAGSLLSVRGGDMAGERVAEAITGAGIADLSAIFLDRATPSYTALVERSGDVIAGLADMALYDLVFAKLLRRRAIRDAIAVADAVICDANLPGPALAKLVSLAGERPVFALAISPAKAVRIKGLLPAISCLFMNRREATFLSGLSDQDESRDLAIRLMGSGLRAGVISAGLKAVLGFDASGLFRIAPPPPRGVADTTGAGDALAGATLAGLVRGLPLRASVREGMAAALLTVETDGAVAEFDEAAFAEAVAIVPEAEDVT